MAHGVGSLRQLSSCHIVANMVPHLLHSSHRYDKATLGAKIQLEVSVVHCIFIDMPGSELSARTAITVYSNFPPVLCAHT